MLKWEYATPMIRYDHKKHKDWTLSRADGALLVGLDSILSDYGEREWELVNLVPEHAEVRPFFGGSMVDATYYRLVFKRPATPEEGSSG